MSASHKQVLLLLKQPQPVAVLPLPISLFRFGNGLLSISLILLTLQQPEVDCVAQIHHDDATNDPILHDSRRVE